MKDAVTHRKRTKSESDSAKSPDHKDSHHKSGHKASPQHSTQGGPQRKQSQNRMDHSHSQAHGQEQGQTGRQRKQSQYKIDQSQVHDPGHGGPHRKQSQYRMDQEQGHGGPHRKQSQYRMDQEQGHGGPQRRVSQYRMDQEHGHGHASRKISRDHGYHDGDYYHMSGSSHPIRPRRDTMLSRGHSIHHESDRRSTGTMEVSAPLVFYENTYKLVPDTRFHEGEVKTVIRNVLEENITDTVYDPNVCGAKCKLLSEIIKERVKHLDMERFKIISMVMIGQVFDQSMLVTSRCLWDQRFDNSVSVEYKNGNIIAIGIVFAVYHE